ncbi:PPE domain-containing protein [Kibdelosporangium persicum]|uniref:PPE domain-containing protein n=1 Tax=Kibdelosporangium persicum TaxID=2698649 RepID=A0ABX2FF43_9PSEU|nr:PPE domain-containing protein [Kibdelosporangium persicum]NRN69512.1 hypothetical protein [Kibdelosporangium persicum]
MKTPLDWIQQAATQLPVPVAETVDTAVDIAEGIIFADGSLPAGTNPADIHSWFHDGPGTGAYEHTRDTLGSLATVFEEYAELLKAARDEVTSGWSGPAAEESARSFEPLLAAATKLRQHAANAENSVARQITSFNDTKHRVVPVAAQPPAGPGMKQFTEPFSPDNLTANATVAAYQVAAFTNQDAYGGYQNQTKPQGKALPQDTAAAPPGRGGRGNPPHGTEPHPTEVPGPSAAPPGTPPSAARPPGEPPGTQPSATQPPSTQPPGTQPPGTQAPGPQPSRPPAGAELPAVPPPGTSPSGVRPPGPPPSGIRPPGSTGPNHLTPGGLPSPWSPPPGAPPLGTPAGPIGPAQPGHGGQVSQLTPPPHAVGSGGGPRPPGGGPGGRPIGPHTGDRGAGPDRPGGLSASGRSRLAPATVSGLGAPAAGGRREEDEDRFSKYVMKTEHESELVGDLPPHAPAVIGGDYD